MATEKFNITPHDDVELGFPRTSLDYYASIPISGINNETGVILSIPGFGSTADSEYYLEKLNPYLANKYNCVVVSLNYFGIFRSTQFKLDHIFIENMEKTYQIPANYWDHIKSEKELLLKAIQVLESKGMETLDPRCQILKLTLRDEYQSFGFLPAIDCLTVLGDVLRRFPQINKQKIIAYGSSYGGYIAMLCGKFAPDTFSVIIDNSGFSRAEMNYIVGREILVNDYVQRVSWNNKIYTIPFAFNNPWTIMDETSPTYFGDSKKLIRSLLVREHRTSSKTRYYMFHCESDDIASVEDKDNVASLLENYNQTYYKRITAKDIDGVLFKKYGHAMDASLRKLFDHVAELDKEYGLLKNDNANDFSMNVDRLFNCGNQDYLFRFNVNYTVNVEILDKVKTDYSLIKAFKLMVQIKDLSDSMSEALEYVMSKAMDDESSVTTTIMQDILDAYSAINNQISGFIDYLPPNKIRIYSEDLRRALTDIIFLYENGDWKRLENLLSSRVIPSFNNWKTEMDVVFEPYVTH